MSHGSRPKRQVPQKEHNDMVDSSDLSEFSRDRNRRRSECNNRNDHSTSRFGDAPGVYRQHRPTSAASRGDARDSSGRERDEFVADDEDGLTPRQLHTLKDLFKQQREDIASDMGIEIDRAVKRAVDGKFAEFGERFDKLTLSHDALDVRLTALEAARARQAFEFADSFPTPPTAKAPKVGFDRDANPLLLKCNIDQKAKVAIKEIEKMLADLIGEKGWDPAIAEVRSKEVDFLFTIKFVSESNGAGQADAIMDLLFDRSTKKWREIKVKDVDGKAVRAYIGKDEAPRVSKIRGASKRLAADIASSLGDGHKAWYRTHDGKLVVDGMPTARVTFTKNDATGLETEDLQVLWLQKPVDDLQIDRQAITAAFLARENTSWVS